MVNLAEDLKKSDKTERDKSRESGPAVQDQNVYAIVDEGERVPACGIEFDLSSADHKNVTKSLLSSVRRLHINCGHPPVRTLHELCVSLEEAKSLKDV